MDGYQIRSHDTSRMKKFWGILQEETVRLRNESGSLELVNESTTLVRKQIPFFTPFDVNGGHPCPWCKRGGVNGLHPPRRRSCCVARTGES